MNKYFNLFIFFIFIFSFFFFDNCISIKKDNNSNNERNCLKGLTQHEIEQIIQGVKDNTLMNSGFFDGHNDAPMKYREVNELSVFSPDSLNFLDERKTLDFTEPYKLDTDIRRMREGKLVGQFWSVYISCKHQYKDAVRATIEQIDVVYKLARKYKDLELVFNSKNLNQTIIDTNKIASLIGIEGGHAIDSSLGALRMFYKLGVRYMTLTHNCNTPWAEAASNAGQGEFDGLNAFGLKVIGEMNRLGMMIDISHVSDSTMLDVLQHSQSPVIYSHSNSRSVCDSQRNVPDDILLKLKENNGIIMINFYPHFVSGENLAYVNQIANHIDYISNLIGPDFIGLGADYDGVGTSHPVDMNDVSSYPYLFAELKCRGWSDKNLLKLAYQNLIRVFQHVEIVSDNLSNKDPIEGNLNVQQSQCRINDISIA